MKGRCGSCSWKGKMFFKVMMGDFAEKLKLPPAFVKHLNINEFSERAILKDHDHTIWPVELVKTVDGVVLFSGKEWKKFVMRHRLEIGDFLIFQYCDNFSFVVRVFDNSNCEKKLHVGESSRNVKPRGAATSSFKITNPSFKKQLRSLKNEVLLIPKDFSDKYLLRRPCNLKVQNSDGKEWCVACVYSSKRCALRDGWQAFCSANNMKAGDACVFELIGERRFKVHSFRKT